MDPSDFNHAGIPNGSITFRATVKSSTEIGWYRFHVLVDGPTAKDYVDEGVLKIAVDRALFLRLQPGRSFVAYKVTPILGHDGLQQVLVMDLRPEGAQGQILMTSDGQGDAHCIDLCSGMGGWCIGGRHAGIRFSMHIERDQEVAEVGSKVTMTTLVTKEWIKECNFQTWKSSVQTGITIIMPFQEDDCWEKISATGVDLVAASLPCPPWSGLTAQQGLLSEAGRLFDDLVVFVENFQPRILALENVEGLIMHEHWRHIVGKFRDVGFVVVHQSVDKLDAVCPMQRSRASVIFVNIRHIDAFDRCVISDVQLPQLVLNPNPMAGGAIHHDIPAELEPFIHICNEDIKMLKNPHYWPRYWKPNYPPDDKGLVDLRDRVHNPSKPLPCAVAKYGFPSTLSITGLKEKGLVMKLLQTKGQIRWISPFEHLTAMGWPIATLVPRDIQLARLVIGNTISPVHALVTLARVKLVMPSIAAPSKRSLSFFDLVTPLLGAVPKLPICDVHCDEDFLWLQPSVNLSTSVVATDPYMIDELKQEIEMEPTQIDPSTQPDFPTSTVGLGEPPLKKAKVGFPVFDSGFRQQVLCPIHDLSSEFRTQSSIPSNIFQVGVLDEFGCCDREKTFLWKGNALSTPHVLHEVLHSNGVSHEILVPDTWITGTYPRTSAKLTSGDNSTTGSCVHIRDAFDSWKCCIDFDPRQDIRCVLQQVAPHLRPDLIFQLRLNDVVSRWNTKIDSGSLVIVPLKLKKVLIVPEGSATITIFCDHFDTVASVMSEHPTLQTFGFSTCWFHLDLKSQQVVMMEPGDFILDFPFHCWTLHSDHQVTQATASVEIPKCIEPARPLEDTLNKPGKVACIHPFTGKMFEFPLASVSSVCELLDLVEPPVPTNVDIHSEVNGRRIDIATAIADIDTCKIVRFRFFGLKGGAPTINRVRTELMAHGVPESQASNRAKAVITALGEPIVHDILQTADPWAAMKTNCREKNLRLVLPQELKQHQQVMRSASRNRPDSDSATSTDRGSSSNKQKGKGKGKSTRNRDPAGVLDYNQQFDQLLFPDEGFVDIEGMAIQYITKTQVKHDASGVCPLILADAQPFLAMKSLSSDPLAILVMGHDVALAPNVTHIVVPITLKPEATPYLIPASLVQLGDQAVGYTFSGPSAFVEQIPSVVIEISIEKCRCNHWCDHFKPLDLVTQCLPLLRHPTKILSHWSWTWTNEKQKSCSVSQASRLHGYLRIPEEDVVAILGSSGPQGVSVFVKTPDKKLDPKYSHIPLATDDIDEVQTIVQTVPKALGFVFNGSKFKIRCLREDYANIRKVLVPQGFIFDSAPVMPDDKLMVLTSPTNLSVTMKALTDAIQNLGWKATVVRPMGATSWLIKTVEDPPGPHLAINEQVFSIRPYVNDRPKFVAPKLFPAPSSPIQNAHNPWSNYKPLTAQVGEPSIGPTALRFEDVTKEIKENLENKMQQMVDEKMQSLETQMQSMEDRSKVFQQQCNQRFMQVESTVQNSIQGLQQKMDSQESSIISQMKHLFAAYNKQEPVEGTPKKQKTGD